MKIQIKNLMFLCLSVGLIVFSCSDSKISDFERGKIFMELDDFDNAVKSFELSVWNHPDDPDIRYHLAEALRKAGERRKAYRQYVIAAKIGSKEISKRFTNWAWELYEKGDSDVAEIAKLAIISHEKNAEAQFLYGIYGGFSRLPFLRDAIDWSSDKKIVEPIFEKIKNNQYLLYHGFINQITSAGDGYEDFGPVVFTPIEDEIIWSRAKKNKRGRYQNKDIKLYTRTLKDTTIEKLTSIGTSLAFPCCSADSVFIYYSNGERIYRYNRNERTTSRLMKGFFVDLSKNGDRLLFTKNWNIFISDTSGKKIKQLTQKERNVRNFMPKFNHPRDSTIIFLSYSYRTEDLSFFQMDTAGTKKKQIAKIGGYFNYNRPWQHAYDISPDNKEIVFSRYDRLFLLNMETGKEDTLYLYGEYPTFSQDGKKLAFLTREYGERGEVAIVNLDVVFKAKTFFKSKKVNRRKLLKYLEKATAGMEKEKFDVD